MDCTTKATERTSQRTAMDCHYCYGTYGYLHLPIITRRMSTDTHTREAFVQRSRDVDISLAAGSPRALRARGRLKVASPLRVLGHADVRYTRAASCMAGRNKSRTYVRSDLF